MNTKPDETTLALWLDDELEGADLANFELWVRDQPEHLAAREEIRRWRNTIASTLPAAEEPPYPELFNQRIARAIRQDAPDNVLQMPARPHRTSWLMPLAACAGMIAAFWIGTRTGKPSEIDVTGAPRAIPVEQLVYTPESGVKAEWFSSDKASAMVIVLDGIQAIPDAMDFSETAYVPSHTEFDSTASLDP